MPIFNFGGTSSSSLKILFVATEAAPFAQVGGLGSAMYSLPKALKELGHDVRIMLPRYSFIGDNWELEMEKEGIEVPTGNNGSPANLICNVKKHKSKKSGSVTAYFLENEEHYEQRANIYGYGDDPVRWALLSRGTLEFLKTSEWVPDVIVASDWMTGFISNYLKTTYKNDPILSNLASVFSIHNIRFQGMFDHHFVTEMDYDDGHSKIPGFNDPRLNKINGLRRGIMYSDVINTVSPTYAKEITTKEYGETLEDLLKERRASLYGILNGIDHEVWNPEKDPDISHHFSASNISSRAPNKSYLQSRFGLPVSDEAFVVGIVSRLDSQKGLDLLIPIAESLINELPIQFVVVGEGDGELMQYFSELEKKFPEAVATHLTFDDVLPHQVFAGADTVLIPSRFEPSGLTQMEAMRYGAIPIVRKTGGLSDTVFDYNAEKNKGTGFVFLEIDSPSLLIAITRAFQAYRHASSWRALQKRAMKEDFSWKNSAKEYEKLFERAISVHERSLKKSLSPSQ